jgi:hypothetical protein
MNEVRMKRKTQTALPDLHMEENISAFDMLLAGNDWETSEALGEWKLSAKHIELAWHYCGQRKIEFDIFAMTMEITIPFSMFGVSLNGYLRSEHE